MWASSAINEILWSVVNDILRGVKRHMTNGDVIAIGLLCYPQAQQATILGLSDLLQLAERESVKYGNGAQARRLCLTQWHWSDQQQSPVCRHELGLTPKTEASRVPNVMILPPTLGNPMPPEQAQFYGPWLRHLHGAGCRLAAICGGAFILAESGLLNGRTVTVHCQHAERFQKLFPEVQLDLNPLLTDSGDILTTGGVMSWVDLGLHLVAHYWNTDTMLAVARVLMVDPPGRQQRYYQVFSPRRQHGDTAIEKVQALLDDQAITPGGGSIALSVLAQHAGLEVRTLLRRFQKATGMTTTAYIQRLRVGQAQEQLQKTRLPVDRIAWDIGYRDTKSFRKVFTQIVGLTPSDYRRRFALHDRMSHARLHD